VQRCHGDEPELTYRVGLNAAAVRTTIITDPERLGIQQLAVTASWDVHFDKRRTLQLGGGSVVAGTIQLSDRIYRMGPGGTISLGYSYLVVEPSGFVPFVMLSGSLSATAAAADLTPYFALDIRAAVAAGWVLFKRVSPYITARAFGGPVTWRGLTGGDATHVQLGAGLVVGLPFGFDLSAECVPLGEQAVSASIGYAF
jgi:hypothetical protein